MSKAAGFINLVQQDDGVKVIYNCPDHVAKLVIEKYTKIVDKVVPAKDDKDV